MRRANPACEIKAARRRLPKIRRRGACLSVPGGGIIETERNESRNEKAVRSGGYSESIGGDGKYGKTAGCPDGCVVFRMAAEKPENDDFFKGTFTG